MNHRILLFSYKNEKLIKNFEKKKEKNNYSFSIHNSTNAMTNKITMQSYENIIDIH